MLQALRLKQERQSAFGEVESSFSVSIQPLDAYNCRWKQKKLTLGSRTPGRILPL